MYNRRLITFLILVLLGLLVALGRLVQLQLVQGETYAQTIEQSLRHRRLLGTTRGAILDRGGQKLAVDEACYDFCVDYRALVREPVWMARQARRLAHDEGLTLEQAHGELEQRIEWTLNRAAELAGVGRAEVDANVESVVRRVQAIRRAVGEPVAEQRQAHPVLRGLDSDTHIALSLEIERMVAADSRPSTRRRYPFQDLACHVIGRVDTVWAEDVQTDPSREDPLRRYEGIGDEIGRAGVERLCEQTLRGTRGERLWRRGGEVLRETPPQPGRDVRLAIDIRLQEEITRLLQGRPENGAAVVIDVASGDILALVSTPTYDLNSFKRDYSFTVDGERRGLVHDVVNLPLLNRAIAVAYPPGSTVKPLSGLAAVAEGLAGVHTPIECNGYLHVPTAFRCWIYRSYQGRHGPLDLAGSLEHSCNIYFYTMGEKLGAQRLLDWMGRFGLGHRPGTGLVEEASGHLPSAEWLWRRDRRSFVPGDARMMAIGQSLLSATPLQIANAMATIARDGVFLSPRLVIDGGPEQLRYDLNLPPDALQAVQEGMYRVTQPPGGTAKNVFRDVLFQGQPVQVCGKTGTAQASPQWIDFNKDRKVQADEIVNSGDMAWFAGFAPYDRPQIAFVVVLEYVKSGGGGSNCGPIARDLLKVCIERGYLGRP